MDWKYKHFHQERVFPAPRDLVTEAARTFMADSLGWQITNTTEGLPPKAMVFHTGQSQTCGFKQPPAQHHQRVEQKWP